MASAESGRQVRKTRAALLSAFNQLIVERRYADIRIGDIIRKADVGRSTFYEHFRNKDEILRQSLARVLTVIADTVEETCDRDALRWTLEHFRENTRLARGLLNGPSAPQVVAVLAGLIKERLTRLQDKFGRKPQLPLDFAATQSAESLVGFLRAWFAHGASCPAATVAAAMQRQALAATRVLFAPACEA